MFRLLKKAWIPLVIVVVVAVASFLVVRIRGYFGHDFNSGTDIRGRRRRQTVQPEGRHV